MNARDKAILESLKLYRCLSRDQIIGMYFNDLKNPVNSANSVLKRMARDGLIKCSKSFTPYVYFLAETKIKHDSQKIPHFLQIADTIIEMTSFKLPKYVQIEPKFGKKGTVEPDIFCKWLGQPVFIEIQRNTYTQKVMQKKIDLYENYFLSDTWKGEPYQVEGKERFPHLVIVTDTRYAVESDSFKIIQVPSMTDFYDMVQQAQNKPKAQPKQQIKNSGGIRMKIV